MRIFGLLLLLALVTFSCKKDSLTPEEQLAIDIQLIKDDLAKKNLTSLAQETSSGLHYVITQEGAGDNPTATSMVTVKYKGYLLDGNVFDQTGSGQTATFGLNKVIAGWTEGIPKLKKGGKGTFWIPSALGYGPSGSGRIPGNSVLIFEVELVNF
jgi:FKBP-type peptidyl-prolyl cis-trans isomerase FkpA